jgi:glycosyltransferase involved in cell wall biosynthesis
MNSTKHSATIILVAHENRVELQHSLNSVLRAMQAVQDHHLRIIVLDEQNYYNGSLRHASGAIPAVTDISALRKESAGFVFIVPEQTLISESWIKSALLHFGSHSGSHSGAGILRPELLILWGGGQDARILQQQPVTDPLYSLTDTPDSGAVAMPTKIFLEAMTERPPGLSVAASLAYGNIWLGRASAIVAEASTFLLRKDQSHEEKLASIAAFKFSDARSSHIPEPPKHIAAPAHKVTPLHASFVTPKRYAKAALRRTGLLPVARRMYRHAKPAAVSEQASALPAWLIQEWRQLHRIDNRLFPGSHILMHGSIATGPTPHAQNTAYRYQKIASKLRSDNYDYILFAPWLIRGGADKYTIEYANKIQDLRPEYKILVLTTLDRESEWAARLNPDIDYCDFGTITAHLPEADKLMLLALVVARSQAKRIHIINSELAYDLATSYRKLFQERQIRIAATSFSQEIDKQGKLLGYSHSHMPEIYEDATIITTDNQAVKNMWHDDYGFDRDKVVQHRLPYSPPPAPLPASEHDDRLRVMWASRLSDEKLPYLVGEIGKLLEPDNITIDMYGTPADNFDTAFLGNLPQNVTYKGPFNGLSTLPVGEYDAFLYTSSFDGMPNTLLEVGSLGLPIVSSAVGGIPELVEDGKTGVLVDEPYEAAPYATALRALKGDPTLRLRLVRELHDKISKDYSEEQFKASVADMLRRMD